MRIAELADGVLLVHGHENGSLLVLDEEHQELCRLGVAGVSTDQVDAVWTLIERLSVMKSHFLAPFHLHYDRAFEHIDKSTGVMAVDGIRSARGVIHRDHRNFLAGDIGQSLGH